MSGFEKQINHLMDLTAYQVEKIKSQPDKFYLIVPEPECTNVCFWYIPARLRSEKRDHWWQDELGRATAILKVSRVLHSHWSTSIQILSSDWWNFNMLAPWSMP